MKRYDVDRIAEAKYRDCVERTIDRLKALPGDVWLQFVLNIQRGGPFLSEEADRLVERTCLDVIRSCSEPELKLLWFGSDALWERKGDDPSSRADWEEGVLKDLHERVKYAAGDADPEGDRKEAPRGDEHGETFRFDDDDLVFLSKVARRLALLTARPGLTPEQAKTIRRAVAALKKLPELTPAINVQIEVAHRMGGDGFSESYSYAIKLDQQRIEISSSGSQCDPAVGTNHFGLESLQWYANGQAAHSGNRDTWLERLAYALTRPYTVNVTDESGEKRTETV
jgi:hypothetical protein